MRGRVGSQFVMMASILLAGASGRSGADTPPASPPAAQAPSAAEPFNPVAPASFQQSVAPPPDSSLPGVSLKDYKADSGGGVVHGWDLFKPKNWKKGWYRMTGRAPNEPIARQAYAEGDALFKAGKYAEAAEKYKIAAIRWPESTLEEDAMFMLGESYFFSDQYYRSSETFARLLKQYENSRHLDRVVVRDFAIARYWEREADKHLALVPNFTDKTLPYFDPLGNGIAVYESIRLNDPTGPLADDATFATANAYFLDRRYEDADYHYELIRKEYPHSEFQLQSHLLGLRAKLRTYQGAEYDDKPLGESDKLINSTLQQFGAEIAEERDRLVRVQRAIRAQRAEREWENGEYYYRRKYYRAARVYYSNLLKTYPDTNFAEMAQARLDETKNFRPVPKNYWTWVGRVFGERSRDYQ